MRGETKFGQELKYVAENDQRKTIAYSRSIIGGGFKLGTA